MNFNKYLGTFQGLKTEGRFLRLTTAVLACTTCFLVVTLASRPTILTVTPWTLSEDAQVTRNDASRSYIVGLCSGGTARQRDAFERRVHQ